MLEKLRPAGNLDQRRAGSAEISGHTANIRKCWVGAINSTVAQRVLVEIIESWNSLGWKNLKVHPVLTVPAKVKNVTH